MSDAIKYLDYAGLVKFKEELEKLRVADKLEVTSSLNNISGNIGNGTFTVKRNNTTLGSFSANLSTNDEINISVPTSISDLGQTAITEILNLINYGLLDVSSLTEEQKQALHDAITANSDFVTDSDLSTELADYGKIINYDSSTLMIQLKNGNTVLSQFSAADFISDGMIQDVRITEGTGTNAGKSVLLIDFNTDSGITDIEIPLVSIFNASNYYTKTEIDNAGFLTQHQDISGKANSADLATVATSGSYNDLGDRPTIPTDTADLTNGAGFLTQHLDISGKANSADLATVATSGDYNDLTNKPTIPNVSGKADQSDLEALEQVIEDNERVVSSALNDLELRKVDLSDLATVATSGSYTDLTDKPTISTVNDAKFSIKGAGTEVASTTANASSSSSVDIVAGSNITVTPDASNNKITIAASDTTYSEASTSTAGLMSASDKTKLDGIATGATANTGTITGITMNGASKGTSGVVDLGTVITAHQDISGKVDTSTTVNGHALTGNVTVTKSDIGLDSVTNDAQVKRTEMGVASGVATLDSSGKVPSTQLPSYVDDVVEGYYKVADSKFYETLSEGTYSDAITGESDKIYIDLSTDKSYRWGGSVFAEIKASPGTLDDVSDGTSYVRMTTAERTKLGGIATGATANVGTITGITMNGASKGTSGVVDLGTVITSHLDISGKANSADLATVATSGSYDDLINKPTIPSAAANGTFSIKTKVGSDSAVTAADFTANLSSADDITLIQGDNITLTTDTTNRTITIAASSGSTAISSSFINSLFSE